MTERHALQPGSGGQWEVTHYRAEIARRNSLPVGDPERDPATIESLYRKLGKKIEQYGDPNTPEGQAKELERQARSVGLTVEEFVLRKIGVPSL
jgi:hypothetical protein